MKDENGGNLLEITPLPIDITAEYNRKGKIINAYKSKIMDEDEECK